MSPRLGVVAAAITAVLVLAAGASASESTIYPGVGIGKIKLGMSAAQVKKVMGRDFLLNNHETVAGVRYVEYGWDFAHWTVTFEQRGTSLRAVQIATDVQGQRTVKGIGIGTRWPAVRRAYPGGRCAFGNHYSQFAWYLEYLVGHKGGTQTLFSLEAIYDRSKVPARLIGYKVIEVRVRQPFEPYPEFGPDARPIDHCADGWQTTNTPRWQSG